jgi:hypothetical protein
VGNVDLGVHVGNVDLGVCVGNVDLGVHVGNVDPHSFCLVIKIVSTLWINELGIT